ncbi:MAG: hypothetical protein ACYST6_16575 [Planctomycetota bacterium]|jgi:hypothetical protein
MTTQQAKQANLKIVEKWSGRFPPTPEAQWGFAEEMLSAEIGRDVSGQIRRETIRALRLLRGYGAYLGGWQA